MLLQIITILLLLIPVYCQYFTSFLYTLLQSWKLSSHFCLPLFVFSPCELETLFPLSGPLFPSSPCSSLGFTHSTLVFTPASITFVDTRVMCESCCVQVFHTTPSLSPNAEIIYRMLRTYPCLVVHLRSDLNVSSPCSPFASKLWDCFNLYDVTKSEIFPSTSLNYQLPFLILYNGHFSLIFNHKSHNSKLWSNNYILRISNYSFYRVGILQLFYLLCGLNIQYLIAPYLKSLEPRMAYWKMLCIFRL